MEGETVKRFLTLAGVLAFVIGIGASHGAFAGLPTKASVCRPNHSTRPATLHYHYALLFESSPESNYVTDFVYTYTFGNVHATTHPIRGDATEFTVMDEKTADDFEVWDQYDYFYFQDFGGGYIYDILDYTNGVTRNADCYVFTSEGGVLTD
jgi:hypothetical protein